MTKDEELAMDLALEALEMVVVDVKTTPTAYEAHRKAITAIKQALAAPVQEPAVNVRCETTNGSLQKVTYLNVICVEREDDGSLTAVTDHWPTRTPPAAQPAVPEGWKLVPETPTNEMTSAMADALEDPENERSSWDLAENMYRAMLAAAPEKGNTP